MTRLCEIEPYPLPKSRRAPWESFLALAHNRTQVVNDRTMRDVTREILGDEYVTTACYVINVSELAVPESPDQKRGRGIFKLGIWINGELFKERKAEDLVPFVAAHEYYEAWALTDAVETSVEEAHRLARYYQYQLAAKAGLLPKLLSLHLRLDPETDEDVEIADEVMRNLGRSLNAVD